ncbi:MAG: discoidin domain-containing protein, partial [Planctomycetaceae bacterium]|nr:discoidin domain-containing protein [Planctomycetaceae bacterium]
MKNYLPKIILATTVLFMLQQVKIFAQVVDLDGGPMGIERVAMSVGSPIPYASAPPKDNLLPNWVQIDLGAVFPVEAVKLYPYFQDRGNYIYSHNFPRRFRIEIADSEAFANPTVVIDQTKFDFVGYALEIKTYKLPQPVQARYVRLTVLKPADFELWRFEVISGGKDVAEGKTLADSNKGNLGKHVLLRPQRPVGENVWFDHPEQVTTPETWKRVKAPLQTPRNGVTIGGLFKQTFDKNTYYLLNSFSVHDMSHNFLERAGLDAGDYERPSNWFSSLGGSVAGRFLMGAGNTLRWQSDEELRKRMNELVNVIDDCATPEGY